MQDFRAISDPRGNYQPSKLLGASERSLHKRSAFEARLQYRCVSIRGQSPHAIGLWQQKKRTKCVGARRDIRTKRGRSGPNAGGLDKIGGPVLGLQICIDLLCPHMPFSIWILGGARHPEHAAAGILASIVGELVSSRSAFM